MTVLGVFFPSLMGFGILVSGALLVSDVVHKLLPHQGRRRRRRIVMGAYGVMAAAAQSTGRELPGPSFLRRTIRSRLEYVGVALLAAGALWLLVVAGTEAYEDAKGVFYASPWISGLTIGFGIALGFVALSAGVLAIVYQRVPRRAHWLIEHTIVGRLRVPAAEDAMADVEASEGGQR